MKCPFKVSIVYTHEVLHGTIVTRSERTAFEECDEDECPYYDEYADTCGRIDKE